MSSTPLNSRNLTMISRLLREAYEPGEAYDLRTNASQYIIDRFQAGTVDEGRLRVALRQFINKHKAMEKAVDQWDDEGGAVKGKYYDTFVSKP